MRCLYCGKELALLKRWTRGGQFCSEAHQKTYQEEYNRIGLTRLLQAQNKNAHTKASQSEEKAQSNGVTPHREPAAAPVADTAPYEPAEAVESYLAEEPAAPEVFEEIAEPESEEQAEPAWEPTRMAECLIERTAAPVAIEDGPVYTEPWERGISAPLVPEWRSEPEVQGSFATAERVHWKFRSRVAGSEYSAPEVKVTANDFAPREATRPALAGVPGSNHLPSAGIVEQKVAPRAAECAAGSGLENALAFSLETEVQETSWLDPWCSAIAFPTDDAEIIFESGQARESGHAVESEHAVESDAGVETVDAAVEVDSPEPEALPSAAAAAETASREAEIESLTRLHEEVSEAPPPPAAPVSTGASGVADPEPVREPSFETEPSQRDDDGPRGAAELVEMPVRTLAPAKPMPRVGQDALLDLPVALPRLTGNPLRPKMGQSTPVAAGTKKSAQRATTNVKVTAAPVAESKAAAEKSKPAEAASVKSAPKAWNKSESAIAVAEPEPAGQTAAPKEAEPPQAAPAGKTAPVVAKPAAPAGKTPAPTPQPKQSEKPAKPAASVAEPPEPPRPSKAEFSVQSSPNLEVPSFGAAQRAGGSLKVKLAIAGVLFLIGAAAYFVFGGKTAAPVAAPAAAADAAGPSIMVGGGGWVEGWAGDPTGSHAGRQITIYRPSLKLSDYRMEFKGEIETKSLGWVFRAADPENYYAIKLQIVSPGAQPKIALFKYLVAHGHETQVGRVPIDLDAHLDTMYTVRLDVRGPKFITYLQGQQVDTWIDDQLKTGGVGFLNEREERGRIKSVSVSLLNGGK